MLLTLIETGDGALTAASAGAVARAHALAGELGVPVAAVTFAASEDLTSDLAKHGVGTAYVLDHELLAEYSPERWGEALAALLRQLEPAGVLAPASDESTEVMAQAAARTGLPLATNCVTVTPGEPWTLTRQRVGGVLLEDAELHAPVKLVTLAPGGADTTPPDPADGEIEVVTCRPDLDEGMVHTELVDRTAGDTGVTLATAKVVVSGGRGVGSAEGFATLEQLAELIGGAVGCSRVATNNGWRPHTNQVGLTGTKISPDLYIACGISGATQHWVGCMDAKTILAINTDDQAPMVTRAAYAVIGDVHEVLPAVIEEVKRRAG
ncbi:electron transfer flavoprotein subunit alpha/FixB family protein [Saccharopolyspora taberi]|uniref:Electron transfer flavoprotein subunit alpha/FixB family protein n=1 Tax=Saccharopolyspora taberi TaxID=60895 RepID=A0ABN3VGW2_9PSEU